MTPGLPYDHQLEYVESTGSQYIDTGIVQADNLEVTITYQPVLTSGTVTWGTYFGCGYSDNSSYNILGRHYNTDAADFNPWFTNSTYGECRVPASTIAMNTMTVKSGRCIKDGVNYTISSVSGRMRSYTMYLFSANYSNTSWRSQPCRISRFTVSTSAGTKLADYIPVSVNGVAKMYDRVTGTFPKHYGTFVAGPVASTPVMGLHFYPKAWTTDDYVQDGLIGMWDGIENAGKGKHNNLAHTWAPVVGDAVLNIPATATWGGDSLHVIRTEGRADTNISSSAFHAQFSQAVDNIRFTFQNVWKLNGYGTSTGTGLTRTTRRVVGPGAAYGYLCTYGSATSVYLNTSTGGSGYYWLGASVGDVGGRHAMTATYVPSGVRANVALYFDGVKKATGIKPAANIADADVSFAGLKSSWTIGPYSASDANAVDEIYCCRVYNRDLTEAEIAHNHLVDRMRFGVP